MEAQARCVNGRVAHVPSDKMYYLIPTLQFRNAMDLHLAHAWA